MPPWPRSIRTIRPCGAAAAPTADGEGRDPGGAGDDGGAHRSRIHRRAAPGPCYRSAMAADGLSYRVSLPRPTDHLASVEVDVPCAGLADDHVDVSMPAWSPGSYLIRDYARFVRDLEAVGDDGAARAVRKVARAPGGSSAAAPPG